MDKDVIIRIEPDCATFINYPMQLDNAADNLKMALAMVVLAMPQHSDLLAEAYRRAIHELEEMSREDQLLTE